MGFVTPLMLLGLAGVAIPIIIHLIGRQRARVVKFAALDFLIGSDEELARKLILRDRALLLARVLVCTAVVLVLAKPFAGCDREGPTVAAGPQAVVLIVDDGLSSHLVIDGETAFSRAQAQAKDILSRLDSGAEVAVVFTASDAGTAATLSPDQLRVADTIADRDPSYSPTDLGVALRQAAAILQSSDHSVRTAYLFSPLARGQSQDNDLVWPEDSGHLEIIDLGSPSIGNVAIVGTQTRSEPNSGGLRIDVNVRNYGNTPAEREVTLLSDGEVLARATANVPATQAAVARFSIRLPEGKRTSAVTVELAPDSLPTDDRHFLLVSRRQDISVALINGDRRARKRRDELFYLRTALRPGDQSDSGITWIEATPGQLPELELSRFDVVVLANVAALDPLQVTRIRKWVDDGGGLLVGMGDNVDADAYNGSMVPLLPQKMANTVDLVYGPGGQTRQERAVKLDKLDYSHPVLSVFPANAPGLLEASFEKIMLLGPTTAVDKRHVIARYDSGAAALISAELGRGRLCLFTSSLDRDWNNLAIFPGYLPLMQRLIAHLARRSQNRGEALKFVGGNVPLPVQEADKALVILRPDDRRSLLEGDALRPPRATFAEANRPGFYRVSAVTEPAGETRRPELDFVVNVDPRGSNTSRVKIKVTSSRVDTEDTVISKQRRVELWHAIACAVLLFLLLESLLVLRQRH